jgi:hypothetical protein
MKRVALSVALLLVWLAPKLESTAIACLSRNPCKQPPCELFYELKIMKAMARLWSLPVLRNEQDSNRVTAKITKLSKKYAKCPANYFYQPPPIFTLGPGSKCDIVYPPGTSSLDQVLAEHEHMCRVRAREIQGDRAGPPLLSVQLGLERPVARRPVQIADATDHSNLHRVSGIRAGQISEQLRAKRNHLAPRNCGRASSAQESLLQKTHGVGGSSS